MSCDELFTCEKLQIGKGRMAGRHIPSDDWDDDDDIILSGDLNDSASSTQKQLPLVCGVSALSCFLLCAVIAAPFNHPM